MRAPGFWWKRTSPIGYLLWPLGYIYGTISSRRLRERGPRADVPVICVGNFVMGGAGKTPTVIAIAKILKARGETPVFLTRGYGGALSSGTPVVVRLEHHTAREVGDEACLLARAAPTIVCADRVEGARTAAAHGASVILMDDGLQNPTLAKDLSFAVFDGATGVGNGFVFPAGPLRAPLAEQIPLVSMAIIIGEGEAGNRAAARFGGKAIRIFRGNFEASASSIEMLRGRRVIAFAGIGRPEKFFASLEETGAEIVARRAFDDHHHFTSGELRALSEDARRMEAVLVTTEKDYVRLPAGFEASAFPVELVFDQPGLFDAMLASELQRIRALR